MNTEQRPPSSLYGSPASSTYSAYPTPPLNTPPPHQEAPSPAKSHKDLFQDSPTFKDAWAAILFICSFLAFFLGAVYRVWVLYQESDAQLRNEIGWDWDEVSFLFLPQIATVVVSLLASAGWIFYLNSKPLSCIKASFFGSAGLHIAVGLVHVFLTGQVALGIILLFIGLLIMLMYLLYKRYIPFTASLLKWAASTMIENKGLFFVNLMTAVFNVGAFIMMALIWSKTIPDGTRRDEPALHAATLATAFIFFWTVGVNNGVSRVTASGVFATRYFFGPRNPLVVSPTIASLKRACTYSFGSVCFGSLLVAIVQFLRWMLDNSKDRRTVAGALAGCLLDILNDLLQYFNTYAYTYVAIYGHSFVKAGKLTFDLLNSHGVSGIINDNIVGQVMSYSIFTITLLSCNFCMLTAKLINPDAGPITLLVTYALGFVISLIISWCLLRPVKIGATTFFVCLAEDPSALRRSDPAVSQTVATKYGFVGI